MRRAAATLWILALLAVSLTAQEHPAAAHETHGETAHAASHGPAHLDLWKLANFVLFFGAAGYLLRRRAGAFFRSRTAQIQHAMAEAARLRQEAEERCAAIEQRLAGLGAEIESLRRKAREEASAEEARLRGQIEQDIRKIQAEAEQEIAAALKGASQQLRAQAAELAVALAASEIRRRLTPEREERLLSGMVRDLERRAPGVC